MASAVRMFVFTLFCHAILPPSASQPSNQDKYVYCFKERKLRFLFDDLINKTQMTTYGGRNYIWHSFQAGILKNSDE
jgi:hypothetical protein